METVAECGEVNGQKLSHQLTVGKVLGGLSGMGPGSDQTREWPATFCAVRALAGASSVRHRANQRGVCVAEGVALRKIGALPVASRGRVWPRPTHAVRASLPCWMSDRSRVLSQGPYNLQLSPGLPLLEAYGHPRRGRGDRCGGRSGAVPGGGGRSGQVGHPADRRSAMGEPESATRPCWARRSDRPSAYAPRWL